MSIPVDAFVDLTRVLIRHGVYTLRPAEMNALIAALTPCFQPGYNAPGHGPGRRQGQDPTQRKDGNQNS